MQRRRAQAACHAGRQHQRGNPGRDAPCGINQLILRAYEPSDLSGLLTCWEAAIRSAEPVLSEGFILSELGNIRRDYLPKVQTTVVENGQIQGFICMLGTEVAALFVHPFEQRMGIGGALLKTQNAQTLEVFEANTRARQFYEKHGFRQTHTRIHEETGHMLCCMALDERP